MEMDREATIWDECDPSWLFRCKPADFDECFGGSICLGVCWLPGMISLLTLHTASFLGVWYLWEPIGAWSLLTLFPLAIVWGVFIAADVKFRRQRPTWHQRCTFDNHAVNWFGFTFSWIVPLVGLVSLVCWWVL